MSRLPVRSERDLLSPVMKAGLAVAQGLVAPLSAVAIGFWAVYTYRGHQIETRAAQTIQTKKDNAARLFEAQKPFNELQLKRYAETARVVGRLVSTDTAAFKTDEWNKDVRRYEALYWTELSMVEDDNVKTAMQNFRPILVEINKKDALTDSDRTALHNASYSLARALNQSISSRWTIPLRND